ncbi:ribosomal-protein-serine acetyltransferase-like [Asterias amurensis]|uniref:ribosomal-protein-serine acetyltransferase-like n=1 Tax=Asterias amurensis TaxID=7602 RepID=UPI003AB5DF9D
MDSLQVPRYFPLAIRESVFIRPVKETDASALFDAVDQSRASLSLYLPWVSAVKNVEDSACFVKSAMAQEASGNGLHCVIYDDNQLGELEVFGVVSLRTINAPTKTADIGYWLREDKVGMGLCTMSCKKLIEYGQAIGIEHFEIHVATDNDMSAAIPKRLGFQKKPGKITVAETINNEVVDHHVYLLEPNSTPDSPATNDGNVK